MCCKHVKQLQRGLNYKTLLVIGYSTKCVDINRTGPLQENFYVMKDAAIIVILPGPLVKWLSRCFVHGNKMEKDKLHFVRSTKSRCPSINVYYDRQTFFISLSLPLPSLSHTLSHYISISLLYS